MIRDFSLKERKATNSISAALRKVAVLGLRRAEVSGSTIRDKVSGRVYTFGGETQQARDKRLQEIKAAEEAQRQRDLDMIRLGIY